MDEAIVEAALTALRMVHPVPQDHTLATIEAGPNALDVRELAPDGSLVREFCVLSIGALMGGFSCKPIAYQELLTDEQRDTVDRLWREWFDIVEKDTPKRGGYSTVIHELKDMPDMFSFRNENNLHGNIIEEMLPVFHRLEDRMESMGYRLCLSNGPGDVGYALSAALH